MQNNSSERPATKRPAKAKASTAAPNQKTASGKARSAKAAQSTRAEPVASQTSSKTGADAAELPVRIIKKYPNRRLYDTNTSTYITLADVRALVMTRSAFAVRDAKTNEDLTRSILLQIILEEEAGGAPMFTEQVLANIIRFYGHAMQGFMGSYLEKNVQNLMELQTKLTEQSKGLSPEVWSQFINQQSPLVQGVMGTYLEQSKLLFTQMQDQLQKQSTQMLSGFGIKR